MREDLRRAVAFIVASLARQTVCQTVYSYTSSEQVQFSGTLGGDQVAIYDHRSEAHITGTPPELFHHGLSARFELELDGASFTGFDYGSGVHFQGTLSETEVQLYDGEWRHFLVS